MSPAFSFGGGGVEAPGRGRGHISWQRSNLVAAQNPGHMFPGSGRIKKPFAPMKKKGVVSKLFSTTKKVGKKLKKVGKKVKKAATTKRGWLF
jgi:hypothetical protein